MKKEKSGEREKNTSKKCGGMCWAHNKGVEDTWGNKTHQTVCNQTSLPRRGRAKRVKQQTVFLKGGGVLFLYYTDNKSFFLSNRLKSIFLHGHSFT